MQIGDLVRKIINAEGDIRLGIVIAVRGISTGGIAQVCWGTYGTFWDSHKRLEVIS